MWEEVPSRRKAERALPEWTKFISILSPFYTCNLPGNWSNYPPPLSYHRSISGPREVNSEGCCFPQHGMVRQAEQTGEHSGAAKTSLVSWSTFNKPGAPALGVDTFTGLPVQCDQCLQQGTCCFPGSKGELSLSVRGKGERYWRVGVLVLVWPLTPYGFGQISSLLWP